MGEASLVRVKAFFNEFPFVRKAVKDFMLGEEVLISGRPCVKRVDLGLMDRLAYSSAYFRKEGGSIDPVSFTFFSSSGDFLGEVVPCDIVPPKYPITWVPKYTVGETVMEAARRIGPERIAFILELRRCRGFGTVAVVLHKIPKGRTFSEWLSQLPEIARAELLGDLAVVDSI